MSILKRESETMDIKGLKAVTVKKNELLHKIVANRNQHKTDFLGLISGYREQLVNTLKESLKTAETGGAVNYVNLPHEPKDHTKDYDRVIAMLEMSVDEQLELPATEFARYALDEWDWSHEFNTTKAMYSGG